MKLLTFLALAILGAAPAQAQLAQRNQLGITMGHVHLVVKDVEAQKRFWISEMGGTLVKNGSLELIQFPGVYVMLRQGEASGPPAGTILNHFGFTVKDMPGSLAKWRAAGLKIDPTENPNEVYLNAPDGIRLEVYGEPALPTPVSMNHLHYSASDVPGIKAWYVKVFGANPGRRPCIACLSRPSMIEAGDMPGVNLSFGGTNTAQQPTKGRAIDHIGFDVSNLEAFVASLEAKGIKMDSPVRQVPNSNVKVAFLTDPYGTYIELTEGLEPAASASASQSPQNSPQPTDRYATVNGLRLHYLDWGNPGRPPLIMLHGIGRLAHTFDHIAPRFTDRFHVIAVDMRGHGDSAWDPNAGYLVEDYTKDLEALVAQLQLRNLTLWGNSTGGRVVQVYSGLHPDNVAALIVEDVGPERPRSIADGFARQVQQDANGWASEDELVAQLRTGNQGISDDQLRTYAHFGTKRGPDGRIIWKRDPNLAKGFVETELWQYVRKISSPTIYVIGGRSAIVPAETQEQLKKTIQGVEIVTMPGLGHYPSQEKPAEFTAIVNAFLAKRRG